VGIYLAFMLAYLIYRPYWVRGDLILVGCSTIVFLLGLVDDVVHLRPSSKLVGQIVAASALTAFTLRLGWTGNTVVDMALTIFWLVAITNALNLLDNIDGLAAGIACIAAGFLVYFYVRSGQFGEAYLAACLVGAGVGFLAYNFHPASIFMGDSGSHFLGFFLAGVTLLDRVYGSRKAVSVLAVPVLLMLIPIVDTTLVTLSRKLERKPVSQGGKDHTSHRLVALGMSERAATLTLWGLGIVSGLIAVLVRGLPWSTALLVVAVFALAVVLIAIYLGRVRVHGAEVQGTSGTEAPETEAQAATKASGVVPVTADLLRRLRVFEVLNDLIIIFIAYFGAFLLRWEGTLLEPYYTMFLKSLPGVVGVQMAALLLLGLYRGVWRYTSIGDLLLIFKGVAAASAGSVMFVLLVFRFEDFSRAVFVLDALLLLVLLAGSRLSFRLIQTWLVKKFRPPGRRTLIYGAGDAGELLLREILSNPRLELHPIAFLDDDPAKEGKEIQGLRILRPNGRLGEILSRYEAEDVVVSTARLSDERWEAIKEECSERSIRCRRMRILLEE
jgi:UDP-GlcNAc:undecaprenyl-phosphate GlcNAc-1-phosphate transferase